jgi:hypothetical protein
MIECKTAAHAVTHPSAAEEAGKFIDAFHGDVAVLLGPDFFGWADILAELKTHRVTALSVPDLVTLLELCADPLELRAIFIPGFADDAVNDLVWEPRHGKLKRILTVSALVQREGWSAQHIAAAQHVRQIAREQLSDLVDQVSAKNAHGEQGSFLSRAGSS